MEVDPSPDTTSFLAPKTTVGSLSVKIHPLAVLNISDHFSREYAQGQSLNIVIGALLGSQEGIMLEIVNSFEVPFTQIDSMTGTESLEINASYLKKRLELYSEVYPDLDCIGWYCVDVSNEPTSVDLNIHSQFVASVSGEQQQDSVQSPIILIKMSSHNNNINSPTDKLPINCYESVVRQRTDWMKSNGDNELPIQMVAIPFQMAHEQAERIGVEHIALNAGAATGGSRKFYQEVKSSPKKSKMVDSDDSKSNSPDLIPSTQPLQYKQVSAVTSAVHMLKLRATLIVDYLNAVKSGELEFNPSIMRDVNALLSKINKMPPLLNDGDVVKTAATINNTKMVLTLSNITHACATLESIIAQLNTISNDGRSADHTKSLFYPMPSTGENLQMSGLMLQGLSPSTSNMPDFEMDEAPLSPSEPTTSLRGSAVVLSRL